MPHSLISATQLPYNPFCNTIIAQELERVPLLPSEQQSAISVISSENLVAGGVYTNFNAPRSHLCYHFSLIKQG